jgi:hypothetical protein
VRPGQVRSVFLEDHARLRGKASVLRSLASQVIRGDHELTDAMRRKGLDLQEHLIEHIRWEESVLLPLLQETDKVAAEAANHLFREHRGQRKRLGSSLVALEGRGPDPTDLAIHLLELIRWLERDMTAEEARVLDLLPVEPASTGNANDLSPREGPPDRRAR